MRTQTIAGLTLLAAGAPAFAQDTVQVTNGGGKNSNVVDVGPKGTAYVAISSAGDLTPGAPGNSDNSTETYLFDYRRSALTQVTNYSGAAVLSSTPLSVLSDGALLLQAQADLTPGAPGHATVDLYFATYLFRPATVLLPASLIQITPSGANGEGLAQPMPFRAGRSILFECAGDPIGGSNADGSTETIVYDRGARTLSAITAGSGDSHPVGPFDGDRRLLIESGSDLTGTGANGDGSSEIFSVNVAAKTFEQLTHEVAGVDWSAALALGAERQVFQRRDATVVPTIYEEWIVDLRTRRFERLTSASNGVVNEVKGVVPGTRLLLLNTKSDFVPVSLSTPGNADHTLELFTVDLRTRSIRQRTQADRDVTLRLMPRKPSRPAVLTSRADLTPGAPGNAGNLTQVYLLPLGGKLVLPVQATSGDRDCTVAGLDDRGDFVAISSKGDLVPASLTTPGNPAHVQQIFILSLRGGPALRQMTVADKDVTFKGFLHDGRSFLVQTKSDLTPGLPGNPLGGTEVYRIFYR